MKFDLKTLRQAKNIPAKDMVEVVKLIYPKYDKTIQSKCENGDLYGVSLKKNAVEAIVNRFAPELKAVKDGHRLKCKILCRLEDDVYKSLLINIKYDGFNTVQDWLTYVVKEYNNRKEQKNESCNNNN